MRFPRGRRRATQHLEGLDESREIVHLDRTVTAQERREGAVRADDRAGVGERRASGSLRAANLEADHRLRCVGAPRERGGELGRTAHGLEEEADRASAYVFREEAKEVGGVADSLAAGRHDGAKADARPDAQECLGDRAGLGDDRDAARAEGVRHGSDPDRRLARSRNAHAVRTEQNGVLGLRPLGYPPRDLGPCGTGLVPQAGKEEGTHTRRKRLVEGILDPLVADEQGRELGRIRKGRQRREALAAEDAPPVRVDEPGRHAAAQDLLEVRCGVRRAVARADHRDRGREEQRADAAAQQRSRSRDERPDPGLSLVGLQSPVMAEHVLLEAPGLAPARPRRGPVAGRGHVCNHSRERAEIRPSRRGHRRRVRPERPTPRSGTG